MCFGGGGEGVWWRLEKVMVRVSWSVRYDKIRKLYSDTVLPSDILKFLSTYHSTSISLLNSCLKLHVSLMISSYLRVALVYPPDAFHHDFTSEE